MNELSYYTLAHGDRAFIHQHVVDAYGAQHIRPSTSTIGAAFALTGLYLAVERGFTGRQVQQMHMVMATEAGPERDATIMRWCASIWAAWSVEQGRVREMVDRLL
jgi:hypothetical protein